MSEEIKDCQQAEEQGLEQSSCQTEAAASAAEEANLSAEDGSQPSTEEQLQQELERLKDTHLRLAEYDNLPQRTLKERASSSATAI